ncbi:phage tail tube protein [Pelagerythrobacter aerophilus]|uniref:Phage tail protein n=1 Tax=Pelagerythrobacter aerophilus TaxID=2306995 RepID=A0A418NJV9_9SPHN|nr:phage tail tube protein [Pelagerythrobacter aerophilus]RIV79580.1 hypothetical protein D2V04_06315 [Pelagerythrobacter aerophilus]
MAFTTGRIKGNYADILYGDGADPEAFTQLCGINTRGLNITYASAFETEDWDCEDPEAVAQTIREVGAQDWSITGSGLYNRAQMSAIRGLMGTSQNWRFALDEPGAPAVAIDDGYWGGPGFISNFEVTGNNGEWTQVSMTITGTGLLAWTDAA